MSVQTQIDRITNAVESAHQKVEEMGGTTVQPYRVENLEEAIGSIPVGVPHAEEHRSSDTVTWDGDPTGMTVADFPLEDWTFVHVSDATPSVSDVVDRAVFAQYMDSDGEQTEKEILVDNDAIDQTPDGCFFILVTIVVVPHDNATVEVSEGANAVFPKKGIYFALFDDGETHMRITKLTIPGHNLIGGTDPITPEMISAAPEKHIAKDARYGAADVGVYGHARAYTEFNFSPNNANTLLDPDGNDFVFGENNGYYMDMGLMKAFYGIMGVTIEAYDEEITAMRTAIEQLKQDVAALKG